MIKGGWGGMGETSKGTTMERAAVVSITDASCRFDAVQALDSVSLEIHQGEVLGLLGPNGAGKTTLIRAIATLGHLDSGSISVGGFDVDREAHLVRTQIGLAGQYAAVDGLLTGRENLEVVGRLYRLSAVEAAGAADKVLHRLSLAAVADRQVRTYSGGQRRRLDLGASLVGHPRVLLLDEPTTGLDPRTRSELWSVLRSLVDDGTTVLLTTQYLEEADALADRIAVIDEGRIIALGTPAALKQSVGGDWIRVRPRDAADFAIVEEVLALHTSHELRIDANTGALTAPLSQDQLKTMLGVSGELLAKGVDVDELSVHQPTLDEVFLSLTAPGFDSDNDAKTSTGANSPRRWRSSSRAVTAPSPANQ